MTACLHFLNRPELKTETNGKIISLELVWLQSKLLFTLKIWPCVDVLIIWGMPMILDKLLRMLYIHCTSTVALLMLITNSNNNTRVFLDVPPENIGCFQPLPFSPCIPKCSLYSKWEDYCLSSILITGNTEKHFFFLQFTTKSQHYRYERKVTVTKTWHEKHN